MTTSKNTKQTNKQTKKSPTKLLSIETLEKVE